MTLREYKDKYKVRLADMADALGISIAHASDLVNANKGCSLQIAVKIEDYTKGKVSCRDLYEAMP